MKINHRRTTAQANVPSVERGPATPRRRSQRTTSPECVSNAEALLLPGVGHIAALVRALDEQNLRTPLIDAIHRGVPFLGILSRAANPV